MEFYEVIEKRKSIRDFADKKPDQEKVNKILETGIKAPSYNHKREWDFLLINDLQNRLKIIEAEGIDGKITTSGMKSLLASEDEYMIEMYLDAVPKQKRMLLEAPELLMVVYEPKTKVSASRNVYDLNCLASAWCCIENILLAITAEGLYGVTYIPQETERLKKEFQIPEDLEIAALIPFGYKSEEAKIIKQNDVNLNDKIHFEKW